MAKVDILLATYNGEKYIETQLLSVIAQSFKDWRLLVHDDGSNDRTVEIIKYWQAKDDRIVLIQDGIECGAAAANFMYLLKYENAPYCMFCDQDDVWFDNKIEVMFKSISRYDEDRAIVIYSNSYVWAPNDGIKGLATFSFPKKLRHFLFFNSGQQGSVSIFNKKMKEYLLEWNAPCAMHDHILQMIGLTFGSCYYLPQPLMLYRQHVNSVTGDTVVAKNDIKRVLHNLTVPVVDGKHYEDWRLFLKRYSRYLSDKQKKTIEAYLNFPNLNKIEIMIGIIKNRFQLYNSTFRLLVKVAMKPYMKS